MNDWDDIERLGHGAVFCVAVGAALWVAIAAIAGWL